MPVITVSPILLDSAMQPANGFISGEVTHRIGTSQGIVTRTPFRGVIQDGQMYGPDGHSGLVLPATSEGQAIMLWETLFGVGPSGNPTKRVTPRVVSIPDTDTADYNDLEDVESFTTGGTWIIPPYIKGIQDTVADLETQISNIDPGSTASLTAHINSPTPHPAYDVDIPSLSLIFENGLV